MKDLKAERQALRALIPWGWGKQIAKLAGVTEKTVCKFWLGKNSNPKVMTAVKIVLKKLQHEETEMNSEAQKLIEARFKTKK